MLTVSSYYYYYYYADVTDRHVASPQHMPRYVDALHMRRAPKVIERYRIYYYMQKSGFLVVVDNCPASLSNSRRT